MKSKTNKLIEDFNNNLNTSNNYLYHATKSIENYNNIIKNRF